MAGSGFIDIDIVGDDRGVQRMLTHLDSAMSPAGLAIFLHGRVAPWLIQRAKERFANEGDDVSGKWAPLQQSTIEFRGEQFGAGPINVRTHELESYITGSDADVTGGPGLSVLTYPKDPPASESLRTKVQTAQAGKSSPSTVARPVLGVNEKDLAYVMTQLAFHIQSWDSAL